MRRMFSEKQIKDLSKDVAIDVIESGLIDNAKPIYMHSISFTAVSGGYSDTRTIMLLFTEDESAYENKADLLSLLATYTGRILLNGYIKTTTASYIAAYISSGNIVCFDISSLVSGIIDFNSFINDANVSIADYVVKIN